MDKEDLEFLAGVLEKSRWLFYGDLDFYFDKFVRMVFGRELKEWGCEGESMEPDFATAYWLFLSELVALDLAEYGTSPRGAWLTEEGERFKNLCMKYPDAIAQANQFIYDRYH